MLYVYKTFRNTCTAGMYEYSLHILYTLLTCHFTQVISYSTSQITARVYAGALIGDQLARIGMAVAGLACVMAPMSLLTGFYGMNVQEFTSGANISLYDFWKNGMPVLLIALAAFAFLAIWLLTMKEPMTRLK